MESDSAEGGAGRTARTELGLKNMTPDVLSIVLRRRLDLVRTSETEQALARNTKPYRDAMREKWQQWVDVGIDEMNMQLQLSRAENESSVRVMTLDGCSLSPTHAEKIAEILKDNKELEELSLSHCDMGIRHADIIADGIRTNKTLNVLNLSENVLSNMGTTAISRTLQVNTENVLQSLNLRSNEITYLGAANLANALVGNKALKTLDLSENHIGNGGAEALADALKSNSVLTSLLLRNTGIEDFGATELALSLWENDALTDLDLASTAIGDDGVIRLAAALKHHNTALKSINLRECGLLASIDLLTEAVRDKEGFQVLISS